MKQLLEYVVINFFKFDFLIILYAIFVMIIFLLLKISCKNIENYIEMKTEKDTTKKVGFLTKLVIKFGFGKLHEVSDYQSYFEKKDVNIEHRFDTILGYFSSFVKLVEIFPMLGIIGTVLSLLTLKDFNTVESNFTLALTSTFWGLLFSIIYKFFEAFLSNKITLIENHIKEENRK